MQAAYHTNGSLVERVLLFDVELDVFEAYSVANSHLVHKAAHIATRNGTATALAVASGEQYVHDDKHGKRGRKSR